jgi:hypothetical protein
MTQSGRWKSATYISEISKLGRMFFVGYRTVTARPQELHEQFTTALTAQGPTVIVVQTQPMMAHLG